MHSYVRKSASAIADAAETARLLSDPTRLRILVALSSADGDMCVAEIAEAVGSSHSATSHQLAKLEAHGIVRCFRDGQRMCYELKDNDTVATLTGAMERLHVL